jgi:putative ABC transport system substrate-binding protein
LIVRHPERYEQLRQLAVDLVGMEPDVLVTFGTPPLAAAKGATQIIPIVGVAMGDPERYIASLGRPGGNITGLSSVDVGRAEKHLDLVKQAVPKLTRIAVLWNPLNPIHPGQLQAMETAASALGLTTRPVEMRGPDQLQTALDAIARERVDALLHLPDGLFNTHRRSLISFATTRRLPLISGSRAFTTDGALMSYGADLRDMWRRAALYVDRILKGAKPADLPVEQPTKYELVINLKTAKAIGLTIPPLLLLRADQVIE